MGARAAIVVISALASCCGCGGGNGGGNGEGNGGGQPPSTPQTNAAPTLRKVIPNQRGVGGHFFSLDLTADGSFFADPEREPLTYSASIEVGGSTPLSVLTLSGTVIAGTLGPDGGARVSVTATDIHGASLTTVFGIGIVPNAPPVVVNPNRGVMTTASTDMSYDPTKGGDTFTDPDGDRLAYTLAAVSPPRGLSVSGTNVVGALADVGLVTFELTADDGYGGKTVDRFAVAVAAPEPGAPSLPATPHAYADEQVPLPYWFRLASESPPGFFWDTQRDNRTTNGGAALGRVLFYDRRLSLTNTHSCASCHVQAHGFAAPERFSAGAQGVPLRRNSMALANVRYNEEERWFSDLRAFTLESLALMPIEEPAELANFLPLVEAKLAATDFYPALFETAFGTKEITSDRIARALAQFLRAIISYRSRFDRAYLPMHRDDFLNPGAVLTASELHGAELFLDTHIGCARCHRMQIQTLKGAANNGLDAVAADPGFSTGMFRAASLRNIAVTAPYMHDGRFATLREVVDHYDHGVVANEMLANALWSGPDDPRPRRLNMAEEDKQDLEAFLRTLTDDELLSDPRFADPFVL